MTHHEKHTNIQRGKCKYSNINPITSKLVIQKIKYLLCVDDFIVEQKTKKKERYQNVAKRVLSDSGKNFRK